MPQALSHGPFLSLPLRCQLSSSSALSLALGDGSCQEHEARESKPERFPDQRKLCLGAPVTMHRVALCPPAVGDLAGDGHGYHRM